MNKGKVIIVTGGSGLIGRAIVTDLTNKGYTVLNFDQQNFEDSRAEWVQCDVTDIKAVSAALQKIMEIYGRVDGLVNNAYPRTEDWGISFEQEPIESTLKNTELQMVSVIQLCKLTGEKMTTNASIVNITSIYGVVGNDPLLYENTGINSPAAYSAIKGGLINFTRFLAARWGSRGIRVNCISPGGIFDHQEPMFVQKYEERVPMKRMGTPEDIAPVVSFLLSDDAKYITGQNIIVDGGWTAI